MTSELLADGARLGDRFVAVLGAPRAAGWIAVDDLFGARLPEVLTAVGRRRGTDSPAVAGVLLFEQYALRLVAPALAALLREDARVDVRTSGVRAELEDGAIRRLAFARPPQPLDGDRAAAEARLAAELVDGHLLVVAEALHRHTRVGARVLRGTVANAVANCLLHLSWPEPSRDARVAFARAFLARVGLAELVTVESVNTAGERWMYADRGTCCLAFRTTVNAAREQRYCGTCPVLLEPERRALFAQAAASYAARHPR